MTPADQKIAALAQQGCFDQEQEVLIARAPGRLDLMGGNVDYSGGMALQGLIREGIWAAIQLRKDHRILLKNPQATQFGWQAELELNVQDLADIDPLRHICNRSQASRWTLYVIGAFLALRRQGIGFDRYGANVYIESEVPPHKGVSSSAALVIAVLKAASAACGRMLSGTLLVETGQWVENEIAQSACGVMDHAAVVYGQQNRLLPLLCQPLTLFPAVSLPSGICLWGIDSGAVRSTASPDYVRARAATFMGLQFICEYDGIPLTLDNSSKIPRWRDSRWNGYLSNLSPSLFYSRYASRLPERVRGADFLLHHSVPIDPFTKILPETDYPVRAAVRYASEEHHRIQTFAALLAMYGGTTDDSVLRVLGEMMYQSHNIYADTGLGSSRCDELVNMVRQSGPSAGLYGAKMTGGGGGGTVVVLGSEQGRKALDALVENYGKQQGIIPYVFSGSSQGADDFGVLQLIPSGLQGAG